VICHVCEPVALAARDEGQGPSVWMIGRRGCEVAVIGRGPLGVLLRVVNAGWLSLWGGSRGSNR